MRKFILTIILLVFTLPYSNAFAKSGFEFNKVFSDEFIQENEGLKVIGWNKANTYVAGGRNLLYVSSDNGKNWSKIPLPYVKIKGEKGYYEPNINNIYWDGKQFIATDHIGTLLVSRDGYNWNKVFNPTYALSYWWETIEKVNGKYIATATKFAQIDKRTRGTFQGIILESNDLKKWREISTVIDTKLNKDDKYSAKLKKDEGIYTIATNGKITIFGGHHGRIVYTNNKKQFVERPSRVIGWDAIKKIYWNGKEFIAITDPGLTSSTNPNKPKLAVFSSQNGETWKKIYQLSQLPPINEVNKIINTDIGRFVIGNAYIKNSSYVPSLLSFSANYKKWDTRIFPVGGDFINDAVWNGSELIAVGSKIYRVKVTP